MGISHYVRRVKGVLEHIFRAGFRPSIKSMDYDEYWKIKGPFEFAPRYAVFASLIERGASVLDLGCGNGANLAYLSGKKDVKGRGLDISATAVAEARKKGIEADIADAAAGDFEISGNYDYIIISEMLEHIPRPEDLVRKTLGHFNKGLIISIPNTGHYIHRLRLLFGHFPVQWAYHPGEHLRFWTLDDFSLWLRDLGLEVKAVKTHSGFVGLHSLWPSLFCDSAVFLAAAAPGRKGSETEAG